MVFLVLLIVATAILLLWLLLALARLALGDIRYPRLRLHPNPAQGTPPMAPLEPRAGSIAPVPATSPPEVKDNEVLYDESDAERVVREHLYGSRRRAS